MELQPGSRLSSQSPSGAPRRPGPRRCVDGGGEDRISALPDEMLLQVLLRLRCSRSAALTSSLARRWRGLWRHLFELSFREIPLDAVHAALQQVVCPALSRLEIKIPERHRIMDPARVSALLHTAARLAPADLVIHVSPQHGKYGDIEQEIPCFERATSIKLRIINLWLTLPTGGVAFPVLERLYVAKCHFDNLVELIRQCPRLRVLEVHDCWCWDFDRRVAKVHSPTIEELAVHWSGSLGNGNLDIVAPVLKKFTLRAEMGMEFSVLFSTPMVEDLSWRCLFPHENMGIGGVWWVRQLSIRTKKSAYVLALEINFPEDGFVDSDLIQWIAPLPQFSVLEIDLASFGHAFGGMVFNLLGNCTSILRLKVVIQNTPRRKRCLPECTCDESPNWRSQSITLVSLEEIEICGFRGIIPDVDFLKLLFRGAPLMKRMTVRLSRGLLPSDGRYQEMLSIFEANPSVQCCVHSSSGRV